MNYDDILLQGLSAIMTCRNANEWNEEKTFASYHHYEKYDANKTYSTELFEQDYGHGKHTYRYKLYTINLINDDETVEKLRYIISDEELSEDLILKLSPYCQCSICTSKWYHISKYFTCACCIGCLKSVFPQQYQINLARQYMKENGIAI